MEGAAGGELGGDLLAKLGGGDAVGGAMDDVGDLFPVGGCDHGVEMPVAVYGVAEGAEGELTAATEGGEDGALGGDGELCFGVVEGADGVAEGGGIVVGAGFEAESTLAGGGSEFVDGEALVNVLGAVEAVQAGGGEDEGVGLAF